jgi:hypothetical protein
MAASEQKKSWALAAELLEVSKVDTAYADLYLQRARELMSSELTEAQRAAFRSLDKEIASLTSRTEEAVQHRDWRLVRELTARATDLARARTEQAPLQAIAERIHGFDEILVDPFSPGTSLLAGVQDRDLPALRDGAMKRLERLRAGDPVWSELYERRRRALAEARCTAVSAGSGDAGSPAALEAQAQAALAKGDLAELNQLSARLEREMGAETNHRGGVEATLTAPVLANPFPREACDRAARLALAPHRVESMAEEILAKLRPSLQASLGDPSGNTVRFSITIPGDADEALRQTLSLFMNRAFLTSAGTRYIPWFVAEDVLVEDFDEPPPAAASPLLAALGLPRRTDLARSEIEKALRARGAGVVKDLGLDPHEYRVVCIPVDVYTRLGSKLGWGKREMWTHFDGYMASEHRKLMPLAGGDVRFGGLHDLVAVGTGYASDRLGARFAIVQRRRFSAW